MRTGVVVVDDEVGQQVFKMTSTKGQYPVEAFTTHPTDRAHGEGISPRCTEWGADDPDASGASR